MWSRISNIWGKEVRDSLRDRKAVTQSIVIPLFFGIFYAIFNPWLNSIITARATEPLTISAQGIENAGQPFLSTLRASDITLEPYEGDLQAAIIRGEKNAGLIIPEGFASQVEGETPASLTLLTNRTSGGFFGGGFSATRLELALSLYNKTVVAERVQERNVDPAILQPVTMEARDLATPEQLGGFFAAFSLPILVATIVAQGGLFVAIDVTAGEKERGTLESVLVTPATDREIFIGKLLAVFTITLIPVVLTFIGFYAASVLLPFSSQGGVLPFGVIAGAILFSLPLALFFSVVLMIVSVRAKAFKDAQSAATPVIFAALIPSMIAAFVQPTNPLMYLIPVYGPSALVSAMATGTPVEPLAYFFAVAGSLAAAAIGIVIALRVFDRERLLYGT
jgi:sodium transport system permease protein